MKQIIRLTAITIFYGILFYSCDKDENKPIDFRDKYIGRYQVNEKIDCYGPCSTCSSQKDTVIIVNYGLTDSTLSVLGRDVWLDSTGRYYDYHYGLRLWNDSINSHFMNGGLGCGQHEIYEGYRISSKP
jgi:hypothetical protein